jgi:hypothetical protein
MAEGKILFMLAVVYVVLTCGVGAVPDRGEQGLDASIYHHQYQV